MLVVSTIALVFLATLEYPSSVQSQMLLVGAFTVGSHSEGTPTGIRHRCARIGVLVVAIIGIPDTNSVTSR